MLNKQRKVLTASYFLHGQTLETASASKYLGITISSELSWSTHVEDVAARGNRTVGFLQRNFRECTPKVKSATYIKMVCPTLENESAVWDPHKQKDIRLLEKIQSRAASYVTNNYTDRSPGTVTSVLEYLKWTSLEHRRQQIHLGMLYKINNGLVDINPESFFRHADPRTRGSQRLPGTNPTPRPLSFLLPPHSLRMEPPPYIYFFSPFTRVLPESTRLQTPQPVAGPHLSMNIKVMYLVLRTSAPVFYCFPNTQGTDRDNLLTHLAAGLAVLFKSPVLDRKKK